MLIDGLLRRRGVRTAMEITLHWAEPGPMRAADPGASAAVRAIGAPHP